MIAKADVSYRTLHRIADRLTPEMRRAFLRAIQDVKDALDVKALEELLAQNPTSLDRSAVWRALEDELASSMRPSIRDAVLRTGNASAVAGMRFDLTNPHAVRAIEHQGAQLVTQVTEESRAAIRNLVSQSFSDGVPVPELARRIRQHIGLTERYSQAVETYRAEQIDRYGETRGNARADKYAATLLRSRAENIARTEVISAASAGQQASWLEAQTQGLLPAGQQRTWTTTPDERLCPNICEPMDGQVRGMAEPFITGEGDAVMYPPAHPSCRCAVVLATEEDI